MHKHGGKPTRMDVVEPSVRLWRIAGGCTSPPSVAATHPNLRCECADERVVVAERDLKARR
jgi:hypothetical protein